MNYAVILSIFLVFVQIQSAIIGGRTRRHGNEGLQDEESIQAKRILLGAGSETHNVIVRSSRKSEINQKLCDQCRRSKLCEVEGKCQHCSQYCNTIAVGSMRDMISSEEELGIAREPETDIFRAEGQKDRTLVSRMGQDSGQIVQMVNVPSGEKDDQIINQGIDDAVVQLVPNFTKDHQSTSGTFGDGILESVNQDSTKSQVNMRVDSLGDDKLSSNQESRYYVYGMINPGLLLNILSRLTGKRDHSFTRKDNFEQAIILVKSSTPIQNEHGIMEKIGDSTFLRNLKSELDIAETNQHGKGQLSGRQIDRIIQIAYEKAEAISKKMESHIVGVKERVDGKSNDETVGCSKEEGETLPFFPIQPNLYRSGSAPQSEKSHHTIIVEPEELGNSDEGIEKKHSKNPRVIQDNPNMESRSNTPNKLMGKLDENHSIRTQIIDSISDELKTLEHMNIVGSTKNEFINEGKDLPEQKESTEKERNIGQLSRIDEGMADENGPEEESVEENDEARTFHKKKKMNKKGGYYVPSYGYGSSYGNHGQGYSHLYRHALPVEVKMNSDDPHNTLGSAKYIDENIEQINVDFNPNSIRTSNNHEDYKQKSREHFETGDKSNHMPGNSRTEADKQRDIIENTSFNQNDNVDEIIIPQSNVMPHKKKDLAATPGNATPDESPNELHHNLQDHSKKNHKNNENQQSTNKDHMEPARSSTEINDSSRSRISDGKTEDLSGSNNIENIVSSNYKKYQHNEHKDRGQYYRMSDVPSSLEQEEINAPNDSTHGIPNRKMMEGRKISKDRPYIINENKTDGKKLNRDSEESIESNESSNRPSINIPRDDSIDHIPDKDFKKSTLPKNNGHDSLSTNLPSNRELVSEQQLQVDNDKLSTIDQNLPEEAIIEVDDQLADVLKERKSLLENHQKFENSKDISFLVGEAPTEEGNSDQPGLSKNIVVDENMPLEILKVNPQIMSDPSGQNLGLEGNTNDDRPEFSSNDIPSKIPAEIPKFNNMSPAPAFGRNRKIEIDIPNFITAMEHNLENEELPFEIEPQAETIEVKDSKPNQNQNIVGNTLTGNNNDVNSENIDKLITPQEREFLHNFGKIVPAAEKLHLNSNADVYFMGNGIKLPLKVAQDNDGSLALSVDLEKLCECKNVTCSHKTQLLRELDNNMGKIFNESEMPLDADKREKSQNTEPASIATKPHHTDFSEPNGYQNKNYRLHKRSINEVSKKNNLDNKQIEINENKRKLNSESEIENSIFKESDDKEITDLAQLQDLQKFKKSEKQLEERLEKLNEHMEKSSKHYNNMLQKSTKDLLQIKGEDQVVKQRVQLVNDLLKWMKEMAQSNATFDKDNATV